MLNASGAGSLVRIVMQTRSTVGIGVATAGLLGIGIFAWMVCGSNCPLFLTVIASAPSGVLDDDENELQIWTVRMSNTGSGRLTLAEDGIRAEAKVGDHWVKAKSLSTILDVGRYRDMLVLAPYNAEGCRLSIEYLPEPLNLRLMRGCARLGLWRVAWWRTVARRCFPVGWLEPLRSDYVGTSPHWKHIVPEVFFSVQARTSSAHGERKHNKTSQATAVFAIPLVQRREPAAPGFFRSARCCLLCGRWHRILGRYEC